MEGKANMSNDELLGQHPCFHNGNKNKGRMHLPVARPCNIKCAFCTPMVDACYHGCRPGVSAEILSPEEALKRVDWAVAADPTFLVVGIAGPGEPLLSEETFQTFELVKRKYPQLILCASSNGLLLEDNVERMKGLIDTLTVTVNALTVPVAKKIYEHINGKTSNEAFQDFLDKQWRGIRLAIQEGITVKINTVYVKNRNEDEIERIAIKASEYGATIHNILQVYRNNNILLSEVPTIGDMERMRYLCGRHLNQLLTCQRCRADVIQFGDGRQIRPCCSINGIS